ncbi:MULTISPECIES: MOSC domain-containing protein [Paenibacillus]|uniref:MOSC domain-containing protein n=1 Tax=Paenibacillus TaxID=44249 RepID=UPI0022B86578|nr:MOSC domain-containing protein [Paenibacillus caseinilyticus]MCZ8519224.1 MOSC domain-containing protein [Paenibacillus caseinilyticus]
MEAQIIALNIALPEKLDYRDREVITGIRKSPVHESLPLRREGVEGDGQGDLVHHGGRDKALCVYPYGHYSYWEKELQQPLPYGAFGENLTLRGLDEQSVCIGDIFRLGSALVQISQPRQPCFKLSVRYGRTDMPLLMQRSGFTGWYFRVLEEGNIEAPSPLPLVERPYPAWPVAEANRIMHGDPGDLEGAAGLLEVPALSVSWRKTLENRLAGSRPDSDARLYGSSS